MSDEIVSDKIYHEIEEKICYLHLISVGRLSPYNSTIEDSLNHFYSIGEDCNKCEYNTNCLCCLYNRV